MLVSALVSLNDAAAAGCRGVAPAETGRSGAGGSKAPPRVLSAPRGSKSRETPVFGTDEDEMCRRTASGCGGKAETGLDKAESDVANGRPSVEAVRLDKLADALMLA